mgnify:CR=1 FL=1
MHRGTRGRWSATFGLAASSSPAVESDRTGLRPFIPVRSAPAPSPPRSFPAVERAEEPTPHPHIQEAALQRDRDAGVFVYKVLGKA